MNCNQIMIYVQIMHLIFTMLGTTLFEALLWERTAWKRAAHLPRIEQVPMGAEK